MNQVKDPQIKIYCNFRTLLAAMHFNENAHRAQVTTRTGEEQYRLHFPKHKKGDYIVRKVLEKSTFREYFCMVASII